MFYETPKKCHGIIYDYSKAGSEAKYKTIHGE